MTNRIEKIRRNCDLGLPKWTLSKSSGVWLYSGTSGLYCITPTSLIGVSSSPNFDNIANFYNDAQDDLRYLLSVVDRLKKEVKNDSLSRRWAAKLVKGSSRLSNFGQLRREASM